MEQRILDVLLLFFIEIIEANLQKGDSVSRLITNLRYTKMHHPFVFFLMHTSLYFTAFFLITGIGSAYVLVMIVILKCSDLALKLKLINLVGKNGEFDTMAVFGINDMQISPALRYCGAFIYPLIFYYAMSF